MNCLSCTAPTTNGLALCDQCQMAVSVHLEFFPVYFRNLARWRPERAGSRPVPGSREPTLVGASTPDYVSRAVDEAGAAIVAWARCLADDRGVELPERDTEAESIAAICRMFSKHIVSIATLEWAGEFIRGLALHEAKLRRLTEQVAPGWYAGACRHCTVGTYVVPGLTWVTCGGCGATTYARDHLGAVLNEARPWIARPMRLAEAIVALIDTEQSVPRLHKRISKWGERGQIEPLRRLDKDGDEAGPKHYRLGDVMDALASEGETRDDVEAHAS
jgi:hypothetical protein